VIVHEEEEQAEAEADEDTRINRGNDPLSIEIDRLLDAAGEETIEAEGAMISTEDDNRQGTFRLRLQEGSVTIDGILAVEVPLHDTDRHLLPDDPSSHLK
jgi:hypothetical protein